MDHAPRPTCAPVVRARILILILAISTAAPLRAQTVAGPDVFADAGVSDGSGASSSGDADHSVGWIAGVTVTSAPATLGRHWDVDLAGRVAREPVVAMRRTAGGIAAAYVDAIRLSASISFVHASPAFDVAIVGRYAETRLDDEPRLPLAENDNGSWTFLFDAATHVRWYAPRDRGVPTARRRLVPLVDVFAGVRHDRRLHRAGDLQPYDDPTGRLLGGAFVGVWRWRGADGAPRLGVRGGADFEAALRSGVRLPSAGRILVLADFDVRRLAGSVR